MLYWIDVLSSIPAAVILGMLIGLFITLVLTLVSEDGIKSCAMNGLKYGLVPALVLGLVLCFIPSKKTMYLMLAVKTTDHAVNSEIGLKLQRILNDQLDDYIGEFAKKKEK